MRSVGRGDATRAPASRRRLCCEGSPSKLHVEDLTDAQLQLWLDACDKMMRWVKPAKARRTWKAGRERAEAEIAKRKERAARLRDPTS
jgi:hypothetical protein